MSEELARKTIRYVSRKKFKIITNSMIDLADIVDEWLQTCETGMMIYGPSRVGKTTGIMYIKEKLKEKYDGKLPVFLYNITRHKANEKAFLSEFLAAIGVDNFEKGTRVQLKIRLVNFMRVAAEDSDNSMILLLIDEAFLMTMEDFQWLMDIYNNLAVYDIELKTILIGTNELVELKNAFRQKKKTQIIARFMAEEKPYFGIKGIGEMAVCLKKFDEEIWDPELSPDPVSFKHLFFPEAPDEASFMALSGTVLKCFKKAREMYGLKNESIPMKYFICMMQKLFQNCGIYGKNPVVFPSEKEILDSIIKSNYKISESEDGI